MHLWGATSGIGDHTGLVDPPEGTEQVKVSVTMVLNPPPYVKPFTQVRVCVS